MGILQPAEQSAPADTRHLAYFRSPVESLIIDAYGHFSSPVFFSSLTALTRPDTG